MYLNYPRLAREFYNSDVLVVAPQLIGKALVRYEAGERNTYYITETEAYRGEEDLACHARFGLTRRNQIMFEHGGRLYVYLIYGIHWMLNIVTAPRGIPQAILIRGLLGHSGPGKVARALGVDRSFYGEDLVASERIWIEDNPANPVIVTKPRVGIDYAGEPWKSIPWRFMDDTL